jgi:hypothetical protein
VTLSEPSPENDEERSRYESQESICNGSEEGKEHIGKAVALNTRSFEYKYSLNFKAILTNWTSISASLDRVWSALERLAPLNWKVLKLRPGHGSTHHSYSTGGCSCQLW